MVCEFCRGSRLAGSGTSVLSNTMDLGDLGTVNHVVHIYNHKTDYHGFGPGWFIESNVYLMTRDNPEVAIRKSNKFERVNFCPFCGRKLDEKDTLFDGGLYKVGDQVIISNPSSRHGGKHGIVKGIMYKIRFDDGYDSSFVENSLKNAVGEESESKKLAKFGEAFSKGFATGFGDQNEEE